METINRLSSYISPRSPAIFVYMFQQVEYQPRKFLAWLAKLPNLHTVKKRQTLVRTKKALALLIVSYGLWLTFLLAGVISVIGRSTALGVVLLAGALLWTAILLSMLVFSGNVLLRWLRKPLIAKAEQKLRAHPATKIAVLGSYGKTTMKEILSTVLSEAKNTKATPGNMNVPLSHARWVMSKVQNDEEVLIFEYGEGSPGDIVKFANMTHPDYGVLTGIAPNHLDSYKTISQLANDLKSIDKYVSSERLFVNKQAMNEVGLSRSVSIYDDSGVRGWKVGGVEIAVDGTRFSMTNGKTTIHIASQLVGRHQVGPLVAVASLAFDLGLSVKEIELGLSKTKPFKHRMSPRNIDGAWIIDDTYNGNLEGIRAGLALLKELDAKRKIYVTPGLVTQGAETKRVHEEIGRIIADARPDKVVLMQNSVTEFIRSGLQQAGFKGNLEVQSNPLDYYSNLEHAVAASDLVMLQNDWSDNYQ